MHRRFDRQDTKLFQVKYTNQVQVRTGLSHKVLPREPRGRAGKSMLLINASPETQKAGVAQETTALVVQRKLSEQACLFLDQIKREKGVWWMPWQ